MTISKNFVQKYTANDCEGRDYSWKDTEESYENLVEILKKGDTFYLKAARIVEKVFDSETFKIEVKTIKEFKE